MIPVPAAGAWDECIVEYSRGGGGGKRETEALTQSPWKFYIRGKGGAHGKRGAESGNVHVCQSSRERAKGIILPRPFYSLFFFFFSLHLLLHLLSFFVLGRGEGGGKCGGVVPRRGNHAYMYCTTLPYPNYTKYVRRLK